MPGGKRKQHEKKPTSAKKAKKASAAAAPAQQPPRQAGQWDRAKPEVGGRRVASPPDLAKFVKDLKEDVDMHVANTWQQGEPGELGGEPVVWPKCDSSCQQCYQGFGGNKVEFVEECRCLFTVKMLPGGEDLVLAPQVYPNMASAPCMEKFREQHAELAAAAVEEHATSYLAVRLPFKMPGRGGGGSGEPSESGLSLLIGTVVDGEREYFESWDWTVPKAEGGGASAEEVKVQPSEVFVLKLAKCGKIFTADCQGSSSGKNDGKTHNIGAVDGTLTGSGAGAGCAKVSIVRGALAAAELQVVPGVKEPAQIFLGVQARNKVGDGSMSVGAEEAKTAAKKGDIEACQGLPDDQVLRARMNNFFCAHGGDVIDDCYSHVIRICGTGVKTDKGGHKRLHCIRPIADEQHSCGNLNLSSSHDGPKNVKQVGVNQAGGKNDRPTNITVARMVYSAFFPRECPRTTIDHLNMNSLDNRLANLCNVSKAENSSRGRRSS